jgi:hypothetical protein
MSATYREEQGFRQWWLGALMLLTALGTVGVMGYGIYQQVVKGIPWGDRPLSDAGLILVGMVTSVLMIAVAWLVRSARLITEVRSEGLYVRFFPLGWKSYRYDDIASYQVRTYQPIRDYGGWGIRWGREGKAYIAGGNEGLQLLLNDGRKVLIGSQKAADLEAAMRTWKR